jgi:hypothetical protein
VLSAVAGEDDGAAVRFDVDVVSGESSFTAMVIDDRMPCLVLYCTVDCSGDPVISLLARLRLIKRPQVQLVQPQVELVRIYFDKRQQ